MLTTSKQQYLHYTPSCVDQIYRHCKRHAVNWSVCVGFICVIEQFRLSKVVSSASAFGKSLKLPWFWLNGIPKSRLKHTLYLPYFKKWRGKTTLYGTTHTFIAYLRDYFRGSFWQEFHRKNDSDTVDKQKLPVAVYARYIRFHPTQQHKWNCLRVEVYHTVAGEFWPPLSPYLLYFSRGIVLSFLIINSAKVSEPFWRTEITSLVSFTLLWKLHLTSMMLKESLWKHSLEAHVPTAFLVLPNLHSCFLTR